MNIINQKDTSDIYSTSDITQSTVDYSTLLSGTLPLPEDHHYWINVAIDIGNYTRVSNDRTLSSYDVQKIIDKQSTTNARSLCLSVEYVKGRTAIGCHIVLTCLHDPAIKINITDSQWCVDLTAIISTSRHQSCSFEGYDLPANSLIKYENGPAVQFNITVSAMITSSSLLVISTSLTNTGIIYKLDQY
jgi:hypothetical protein